jgi:hypothetical protein
MLLKAGIHPQIVADYLMLRHTSLCLAAAILCGSCIVAVGDESNTSATVSITVSNAADLDLTFTLSMAEVNPFSAGLHAPYPIVQANTNNAPAPHLKWLVKANQSAQLEIPPGQYRLDIPRQVPSVPDQRVSLFDGGYISITKAEVWIFSLKMLELTTGKSPRKWTLEVPSRPELHLMLSPESPRPMLPQRMQRLESPSTVPPPIPNRKFRLPETNSINQK